MEALFKRYFGRTLNIMFVKERGLSATAAIKRFAAIMLLAAFFLPLSQCSAPKQNVETKVFEQEVRVTYAYTAHEWPSVEALATYAAFLWPLMFGIASLVWPNLNQKWTVGGLELLLCLGSGFMLYALTFFDSLRYGGYIAWGAIGMYFITTSVALIARIRKTRCKKARSS